RPSARGACVEEKIGVILVDDDPRIRKWMERFVAHEEDMTLLACFPSADGLTQRVPERAVVMLLDLSMPGRNALEATSELREARPDCRVIIYSGLNDPEVIEAAIEHGAWGMVDKLTPLREIVTIIRKVAQGETVFPEDRKST